MKTKINPLVNGQIQRVFEDASGAPAVLTYKGYMYACDFLGEAKFNLIGYPKMGSRTESKIAARECRFAYVQMLLAATTQEWRERSKALYEVLI
jgi:hypothetical protein